MRLCTKLLAIVITLGFSSVASAGLKEGLSTFKDGKYSEAFVELEPFAIQGNAEAQAALGLMYEIGRGVTPQPQKAFEWYSKAAEQGDAGGLAGLGSLYNRGFGVSRDYQHAAELELRAAELGNERAQTIIASMYAYGRGVPQNYELAVSWYNKAIAQGNAAAESGMSRMYFEGKGVQKDISQGMMWLRKSAEHGYNTAEYTLGLKYLKGEDLQKDRLQGMTWLQKSAEHGFGFAQVKLAIIYANGEFGMPQDLEKAEEWYRRAATQEDPNLAQQLRLANENLEEARNFKLKGPIFPPAPFQPGPALKGEVSKSYQEALALALKGDADAQYKVAGYNEMARMGSGIYWYFKAASNRHVLAQYEMGIRYQAGWNNTQNYTEAAAWFRKAAQQGNLDAAYHLADLYDRGMGVYQSDSEAAKWMAVAAKSPFNHAARARLASMYRNGRGVPVDINEANKLAANIKPLAPDVMHVENDGDSTGAGFIEPDACKSNYPESSWRAKEQGTVSLRISVSAEASLVYVSLLKSSGYHSLDQAAVAAISMCDFKAAVKDGKTVPSNFTTAFAYRFVD